MFYSSHSIACVPGRLKPLPLGTWNIKYYVGFSWKTEAWHSMLIHKHIQCHDIKNWNSWLRLIKKYFHTLGFRNRINFLWHLDFLKLIIIFLQHGMQAKLSTDLLYIRSNRQYTDIICLILWNQTLRCTESAHKNILLQWLTEICFNRIKNDTWYVLGGTNYNTLQKFVLVVWRKKKFHDMQEKYFTNFLII